MSWQETAVSVYIFHKRCTEKHGVAKEGARTDLGFQGWSLKDTARTLCIKHVQVIRYIAAVKAFYEGHKDILERESLYAALQMVKDRREIEALERIEELTEEEEVDDLGYDDEEDDDEDFETDGESTTDVLHPKVKRQLFTDFVSISEGDACKLIKDVESDLFDCVLWDPPFGIDLGTLVKSKSRTVYHDTPEYYAEFMTELLPELYRVMKPDSHIYVFHGPDMFEYTKRSMISTGFDVDKIPWIWHKSNMAGQSNAPDRWPGRVYEPILFGHKGKKPMLMKGRRNVLNVKAISAQRKRHPTQKPVLLYRALLQNSVRVGDLVLDPMAGSGASLIAAAISGVRAQGFEMDRGHFLKIKDILKEELYTAPEIADEAEVLMKENPRVLDDFQKVGEEITND